jgi:hypothetical protein
MNQGTIDRGRGVSLALVGLSLLGFSFACAPGLEHSPIATHPVASGTLATEGVTIRAADGSFTLTAGQRFTPPYQNRCYDLRADQRSALQGDITEAFATGDELGARRVLVDVPGREQPLLGLLLLCDMADSATGAGARSYHIEVPGEYVSAASGGRVSVVFEHVQVNAPEQGLYTWYGWILWLSDQPFL